VVRAFERYPLVALSEWHGARETKEFVGMLIRQAGFAGKVTDIVVEFGNARYQSVIDRYTAGEGVARVELKQIWENTTVVSGVWSSPIYEEFFADIRAFNQALPAASGIRVLLGDPPIDWKAVTSPADEDMNDWRDAHFAWVVEREVISKGRKALLFIGGAHISRKVIFPNSLIHLLDARFPGKTLVISAIQVAAVSPPVAALVRSWPVPSAAEVHDTWLGRTDVRDVGFALSTSGRLEDDIDAVLVLSKEAFASVPARIDPNSPFAVELRRRQKLQEETLAFRGGKIRFDEGSTSVTHESTAALEAVLAEMQHDRKLLVLVKAFADSTETEADELSKGRAKLIVDWLARRGIDRRRLATLGCGSSRPLWDSVTEQHRAANRRAELVRQGSRAGCQPPSSFDWQ
jgi:outer membrane protein OmpA-like peptidoglycan-associated protein